MVSGSACYDWDRKAEKMLEVQRSDFLRDGGTCDPPTTDFLQPDSTGASVSGWKPTEKSVSFNRDVHVKRIGESRQSHHMERNSQRDGSADARRVGLTLLDFRRTFYPSLTTNPLDEDKFYVHVWIVFTCFFHFSYFSYHRNIYGKKKYSLLTFKKEY